MRKLFSTLIILIIIYFMLPLLFSFFKDGQVSNYLLKNNEVDFEILEVSNFKNNNSNYLFEIKFNNNKWSFQINYDYNKDSDIIQKIEYYKDEKNECILPIFKNNLILTDIICYDNGLTYYNNLKGKNIDLDNFVNELEHYNIANFLDGKEYQTIGKFKVYKNNLIDNHYIGITGYKGIYSITRNDLVKNVNIFNSDIYNQKLGIFINNYYMVADYNKQHQFNEFKVIDLTTLNTYIIKSDIAISLDSYIQGVVDDIVYLYDKDNRIQYEINVNKKTIKQSKKIKHYNSGNWDNITISEANNELKFIYNEADYENNNYQKIDKVGNELGYYYLYKKNNNKYDVYRINIQNKEGLIYLFSTENIDNIYYAEDYVYFIENSKIKVFNSRFGLKTLIEYNELQFNKNINFNVYVK